MHEGLLFGCVHTLLFASICRSLSPPDAPNVGGVDAPMPFSIFSGTLPGLRPPRKIEPLLPPFLQKAPECHPLPEIDVVSGVLWNLSDDEHRAIS